MIEISKVCVGDWAKVEMFGDDDKWAEVVEVTSSGVTVQVPMWSHTAFFDWHAVCKHVAMPKAGEVSNRAIQLSLCHCFLLLAQRAEKTPTGPIVNTFFSIMDAMIQMGMPCQNVGDVLDYIADTLAMEVS